MKVRSGILRKGRHTGMFSHADVLVDCGEPQFHDEHRDVLLNPAVIFEVLSLGTEAFDRGENFQRYRTHLETLSDYVLVSTSTPLVEHFSRQSAEAWLYTAVEGLDGWLELPSIGCRLPLVEVYEGVEFAADTAADLEPSAP